MPIVLYAEDSKTIIDALQFYLKKFLDEHPDLKLIFVSNIEEALRQLDEHGIDNIDILFTDGILLGADRGWRLAKKFRARGFDKPIIYAGFNPLPAPFKELYDGALAEKSARCTRELILQHAINKN